MSSIEWQISNASKISSTKDWVLEEKNIKTCWTPDSTVKLFFFSLKVSVIFQNTKVRATIDWVLEKSIETIWTPDSTFRRLLARPSVGQAGGQTNYTGGSQKAFADTNTIINVNTNANSCYSGKYSHLLGNVPFN